MLVPVVARAHRPLAVVIDRTHYHDHDHAQDVCCASVGGWVGGCVRALVYLCVCL